MSAGGSGAPAEGAVDANVMLAIGIIGGLLGIYLSGINPVIGPVLSCLGAVCAILWGVIAIRSVASYGLGTGVPSIGYMSLGIGVIGALAGVGIIAAFNIDEEEKAVSGKVSITDVYGMADERCAIVDYFTKAVTVLEKGEKLDLTLENYDDFRLYYVIPLKDEAVPVGVINKYMAPATFNLVADTKCFVAEGGDFCFVGEAAPENIRVNGEKVTATKLADMLYVVNIPEDSKNAFLEWGE